MGGLQPAAVSGLEQGVAGGARRPATPADDELERVALGWLISHAVANVADNKCPFTDTYPCMTPTALDPGFDLMKLFDVTSTKTKCYEDGLSRERVCTTVDR